MQPLCKVPKIPFNLAMNCSILVTNHFRVFQFYQRNFWNPTAGAFCEILELNRNINGEWTCHVLLISFDVVLDRAKESSACSLEIHTKIKINLADQRQMAFYFRKKLWYCISERVKQFGFIKRVDKGWITTVKYLESWTFER